MNMADRIKSRRVELRYTQEELAEKLGLQKSAIAKYENGRVENIKRSIILKMSQVLECSPAYLLAFDDNLSPSPVPISGYRIPVLATVAAGQPIYSEDSALEWIDYDKDPKDNVFGLRVRGDSMMPRIRDGDIIIVDRSLAWGDNDIVVVTVNGNDGCCKRIRRYADGIMLLSLNPSYEPIYYSKEQVEQLPIRVLGKVIESRSRF